MIDLDEARMGDPALDVAHFGTYLDLLAAPDRARQPAARILARLRRSGTAPDRTSASPHRVFSGWT